MASPHQLWTLSLSFKYSQLTSEEQQIKELKQLHTERHPFRQNYHLNINLQLPLKNLKWKLRNGNVTHVPTDYAKNLNQILGLLSRNMVLKYLNLPCFATILKIFLEISSQKIKMLQNYWKEVIYLTCFESSRIISCN